MPAVCARPGTPSATGLQRSQHSFEARGRQVEAEGERLSKVMADRGLDVWKLQAHARHKRIATTQRYVHIVKEAAVIDAAAEYGRALPMMMTAAGTVPAGNTV